MYENEYTLQYRRDDLEREATQIRLANQVLAGNCEPKPKRKQKSLLISVLMNLMNLIRGL